MPPESQNPSRGPRAEGQPSLPRGVPVDAEVLYELLSDRLLADFPVDAWREVFSGPGCETVQFESGVLTFLSVAGLSPEWTRAELTIVARKHRAHVESFGPPSTFAFSEVRHALDLALLLQRESGHLLRIVLLTAPCTMASFELGGVRSRLSLGAEARVGAAKAATMSEGSIYVWGETWPLIARALEHRASDAVIAKEFEGGVVASAVVSFPPARCAELSTFTGSGLTPEAGTGSGPGS